MPTKEVDQNAERANFVVSGYAFTKREDGFISILNLAHPECAIAVLEEMLKNVLSDS